MVIEFGSAAAIRQSYTNNRTLLRDAVKDVQPTQRPTRIEEALSLAESLANPRQSGEDIASRPANPEPGKERTYAAAEGISAEVHLFSDGRFPDVPDFSAGNLNVHYHAAGKMVATICHGPWVLISAGIVRGRRLTSTIGIRDDVVNAGAEWVDAPAVIDGNLVSARVPKDLPPFGRAMLEVLAKQR